MSDRKKIVSIITPAFNKLECIGEFLSRIESLTEKESGYQREYIGLIYQGVKERPNYIVSKVVWS